MVGGEGFYLFGWGEGLLLIRFACFFGVAAVAVTLLLLASAGSIYPLFIFGELCDNFRLIFNRHIDPLDQRVILCQIVIRHTLVSLFGCHCNSIQLFAVCQQGHVLISVIEDVQFGGLEISCMLVEVHPDCLLQLEGVRIYKIDYSDLLITSSRV